MHKFTDDSGQDWEIALNVGIMEDISDGLDIDLFEPVGADNDEDQVISKIAPIGRENIKRYVNMLFMVCEDQCKERDIDSKQFGRGLGPGSLKPSYEAFYAEWMDFFQSLGRVDLVEAVKKTMEMVQEMMQDAADQIKAVTLEEMEEKLKLGSKSLETESLSTS
jgi:hypothetical protein